jgi:hypothetical protein
VREQAVVFGAAVTVEAHPEDRGVRGSRQLLDAPEGRERDPRLASGWAGERVAARERVVDGEVVETAPDELPSVLST